MVPKGHVNLRTPLTDVWKTLMPINTQQPVNLDEYAFHVYIIMKLSIYRKPNKERLAVLRPFFSLVPYRATRHDNNNVISLIIT